MNTKQKASYVLKIVMFFIFLPRYLLKNTTIAELQSWIHLFYVTMYLLEYDTENLHPNYKAVSYSEDHHNNNNIIVAFFWECLNEHLLKR